MAFAPLRRTRLNQPRGDGIDWLNAKSLSFDLSPVTRTDIANGRALTFYGTKKTIGKFGIGVGFGSVDGVGTTDKIATSLSGSSGKRSYFVLAKLNGWGGGNFGRLFDSSGQEQFYVSSSNGLVYVRAYGSGQRSANTNAPASVSDTFGKVTSFSVSFDSSSTANEPELYINGIRYPFVTLDGVPSGAVTAASNLMIGNRADNTRNCDGTIYVFRSFDCMLSAKDHAELTANPNRVYL